MKFKFCLCLIILPLFLCRIADASSTLMRIRFGYYPDKIRAAFDFDRSFEYEIKEFGKERFIFLLKNTQASSEIQNYVELNDLVVRYFEIEKEGNDLRISIPLQEPVAYNVFTLQTPPRLIIDFSREYLKVSSAGTVADGLEILNVSEGTAGGKINAYVLKADLKKIDAVPVLAKIKGQNFFESIISIFNPWKGKSKDGFALDYVNGIVENCGGLAGVNGTYFDNSGNPLGSLIINQEIISSPILERTAFFVDENNTPNIDSITIDNFFKIKNGMRFDIDGTNELRGKDKTILFTPLWGKFTRTDAKGIEISIVNGKIKELKPANLTIPENGYVISVTGPAVETLAENVRVGDPIETHLRIIPQSTSPKKIIHLISGGPRLLKGGEPYVSKHEEKFRADVAKGRAARTAVGITKNGELLLITVDGLSKKKNKDKSGVRSIGITLEELSDLLLKLGAIDAVNLDGGGSSTMVVGNQVINKPTTTSPRKVSNAIVLFPRD